MILRAAMCSLCNSILKLWSSSPLSLTLSLYITLCLYPLSLSLLPSLLLSILSPEYVFIKWCGKTSAQSTVNFLPYCINYRNSLSILKFLVLINVSLSK